MFGGSLFGDPFFTDIGSQMRDMQAMHEQMMQGLMGFRSRPMQPALDYRQAAAQRPQQVARRRDPFGFPGFGGGIFDQMNSMMSSMSNMPPQEVADPNAQFYSSSTVMSFSNTGNGAPKVYQASSSTRQGPGGVREVRQMERNSSTGVEKVHHGRHIGERGHVVQRQRNVRTGDREENVEFVNLDEEEAPEFEQEWQTTGGRTNQRAVADARYRHADRDIERYQPTSLQTGNVQMTSRNARMTSRPPRQKKVTIASAAKRE